MGLILPSREKKLRLTGVPVRFENERSGLQDLVVNFLTVSTPEGKVVSTGFEVSISLSDLWAKKAKEIMEPGKQLAFDLEIAAPETDDETALRDILTGGHDKNIYEIMGCRAEANPMAAYS